MAGSAWTLYKYPGGEGLPSASPPCCKVFLALRLAGLPHEVENVTPERVRSVSLREHTARVVQACATPAPDWI